MNWQPPDPPEYGHCLTCKSSIHQSEVRGDRCIECEAPMTNKLEITRALLEQIHKELTSGAVSIGTGAQVRALLASPVQHHAAPEGYCLMPTSLTAENGAKSLLIGEFKVSQELDCHECASSDEESDDCEICGGHGSYDQDTPVGWDLMKEIYHKAVEGLALKPEPSAPKCATCQDNGVIGWTSGQTAESFDMGEYECPDCAPADQPQGGRAAPFNTLCYGARFKYTKDEAAEWVKVGHDLIAGWKAENVATNWVGQPLCSFSDDGDVSAVVWLVDDGADRSLEKGAIA